MTSPETDTTLHPFLQAVHTQENLNHKFPTLTCPCLLDLLPGMEQHSLCGEVLGAEQGLKLLALRDTEDVCFMMKKKVQLKKCNFSLPSSRWDKNGILFS